MNNYQQAISSLSYWAFLALVAMLPYPDTCIRVLWVLWLGLWLLEGRILQRPATTLSLRSMLPLVGLMVWVGWELLSVIWAIDPDSTWRQLSRHVNFAAVLLIAFYGWDKRYHSDTALRVLIVSSVISVGVYLFAYFCVANQDLALDYSRQLQPWEWQRPDWLHLSELTMMVKHRLFYACVLVFAIIAVVYLYRGNCQRYGLWPTRLLSVGAIAILMAGIYWSGSRASMISLAAIAFVWMIRHTPGRWKWLSGGLIVLCIAGMGYFALNHYNRFEGRSVHDIFAYHPENIEVPSFEPRIAIWHAALEQPEEYLAYGVGAGCAGKILLQRYEEKNWVYLLARQYDTHNQYLSELMDLGIAGLLLFVLCWLALPVCLNGKSRLMAGYVTLVILLTMMTERYLNQIEGIETTCVMLLLIYLIYREENASASPN